jgi:hypothetical protein
MCRINQITDRNGLPEQPQGAIRVSAGFIQVAERLDGV